MRYLVQADAVADTFFFAVDHFRSIGEPEPSVLYTAGELIEYGSTPASGLLIARDLRLSGEARGSRVVRPEALKVTAPVITALLYCVLYDVAVVGTVIFIVRILKDSV